MNAKVLAAIHAIGEVEAKDLDECSVKDLALFSYWLHYHQGSVFVKTVGRMAGACDGSPSLSRDSFASARHQVNGAMI